MVKTTDSVETEVSDEDWIMVRLISTFAAATRLSGKKMSSVEDAAVDTIKLAKKLEQHILEG